MILRRLVLIFLATTAFNAVFVIRRGENGEFFFMYDYVLSLDFILRDCGGVSNSFFQHHLKNQCDSTKGGLDLYSLGGP